MELILYVAAESIARLSHWQTTQTYNLPVREAGCWVGLDLQAGLELRGHIWDM
jgi:hypothetical protein